MNMETHTEWKQWIFDCVVSVVHSDYFLLQFFECATFAETAFLSGEICTALLPPGGWDFMSFLLLGC